MKLFKEGPGRERSITVEQAETLLGELPAHQRDVVLFALATGLRQSNVLGLEWSHVEPRDRPCLGRRGSIEESQADCRAAQRDRAGGLATTARQAPRASVYLSREAACDGPTRGHGEKALKRAGIENFRWHDLRHTWASWHRQAGTPTHELQRLGGWRSSVMVERYAHLGARPSRESRQPARFAARWLRFGYAGEGKGISRRR